MRRRNDWQRRRDMWNDLGCKMIWCPHCSRKTEHENGTICVECERRYIQRKAKKAKQQVRSVTVSKYIVKIYPNGKKYCSCKGFQFRKTCKHLALAK